MSLINLQQVSISYGQKPLLDKVNLKIDKGERICIIGRNGMGKSTLLKIIKGSVSPDSGVVERQQSINLAYLPQEIPQHFEGTVYEIVASGLGNLGALLAEYEQLNQQLAIDFDAKLLTKSNQLYQEIDRLSGWNIAQKITKILTQTNLHAKHRIETLSGGLKRRVLLAKVLINDPDILLLDEPTNHLDIESIEWVEKFLLNSKKTLLFISHDRTFMQTLASRIVELDNGELSSWSADYQDFLKHKSSSLVAEQKQETLFDKKLAQEEAWIRQGIKARRTRNEGRVKALEKMREERKQRRQRMGLIKFTHQSINESGRIVFELINTSYQYNNIFILKKFSTTIMRGDKIGIIGPNGSGKTTLLKIILGELKPTGGLSKQGTHLNIAYYDQIRSQLDENSTVIEVVGEGNDMIIINNQPKHIVSYLQDFLFAPERARTPIRALSGGERNRLLLAKLFTKSFNVLVMDEPTNDLDVETLELLEEQLLNYSGTLLLVSHDRAFLNHIVTSTLVLEGDGQVGEYIGGYNDWLKQRPSPKKLIEMKSTTISSEKVSPKSKTKKLSYKEQKELELLPQKINELEKQLKILQDIILSPQFYQCSQEEIKQKTSELAEFEIDLKKLYQRWEELEN